MATDAATKNNKKKSKKKARKDKWGQPVLTNDAIAEAEEEILEAKDKEEKRSYGGGGGGGGSYEPSKVVLSGMPYSTTEEEIRDLFKDIGQVHQLQLSRFPDTGNFRGLAFVTFEVAKTCPFVLIC